MSKDTLTHQLTETIDELSCADSLKGLFHQHRDGNPLPSGKALEDIINLSRSILFPGYFGNSSVNISTIKYHIGVRVEKLYEMLAEQILAGLCFANDCETETQAGIPRFRFGSFRSKCHQPIAALFRQYHRIEAEKADSVF